MFVLYYVIHKLTDAFIGALGGDIYQLSKELLLKQITLSLSYIQTAFIIAGFGLIAYDILIKSRKEKQMIKQKRIDKLKRIENGEPDKE
jgi:hypothetical protein